MQSTPSLRAAVHHVVGHNHDELVAARAEIRRLQDGAETADARLSQRLELRRNAIKELRALRARAVVDVQVAERVRDRVKHNEAHGQGPRLQRSCAQLLHLRRGASVMIPVRRARTHAAQARLLQRVAELLWPRAGVRDEHVVARRVQLLKACGCYCGQAAQLRLALRVYVQGATGEAAVRQWQLRS